MSVWCVSECSGNLFTSSTLFEKANAHFYPIDYELHVSDTDVFFLSPFSLFSYFCYQTDYKKKIQSKSGLVLWMFRILNTAQNWVVSKAFCSMDVQLLRINFSFEKKKSMQTSTLF